MRVMFAVFPAPAHFLPVVPYAWALQSAGHEVCVASVPGVPTGVAIPDFHRAVTAAGLTAVSCGEPQSLSVHDGGYPGFEEFLPTMAESQRYVQAMDISPADRPTWDVFYHFTLLTIRNYHPPEPRQDVDALIDFTRRWRPDLVLWDPWFPCGAVAARLSGAAHARLLMAQDYTGWVCDTFARLQGRPNLPENPLRTTIQPLADRYGVAVDDELLLGQWTIDPFPPGMSLATNVATVQARYVPYTGAGVLPEWLYERTDRRRIALSLGVSTRMFFKGDWGRTAKLMEAVAGLDAEVVATLNSNQLLDMDVPVPDNVRTIDYVPLTQLLPTSDMLIHHGSPATFWTAAAFDIPQLICDTDEPARIVAAVTEHGVEWNLLCQRQITATHTSEFLVGRSAGARLNHQTMSPAEIRAQIQRVLDDPSYQAGATSVYNDWLATPSPADIVPALEKLTMRNRRQA
jgi:UDP:flavonoid glycosyltransferase YjiC (YdhE family)